MLRLVLALTVALLALAPAGAMAQYGGPRPNSLFEDHLHGTRDSDWHIQFQTNKTATKLTSVVVYAATCGESGLATKVPVAPDGTFALKTRLADGKGTWSVRGQFTDADTAVGTWTVLRGKCTVVDHPFGAHDGVGHSSGYARLVAAMFRDWPDRTPKTY